MFSFFMFFIKAGTYIYQKNKSVTLQVRIARKHVKGGKKRAFSLISQDKKGSMTIEAALALPLFLFAMVMLMTLFSVMNRQRQVQAALESVCEDISKFAYAAYEIERGEMKIKPPGEEFYSFFEEGRVERAAMEAYAQIKLRGKLKETEISGLSLRESSFMEDGEMIHIRAAYEIKLPFPLFRMSNIAMVSSSSRRAWIGRDGGWLKESGEEAEEDIVYVGKGGSRYHKSRTCHYIYNQLTGVSKSEIDRYRNTDGGKYHPCARCGNTESQTVYIMPSGSSFHSTASCSAIASYVRAVKKSEAAHLGACSYCSGGG